MRDNAFYDGNIQVKRVEMSEKSLLVLGGKAFEDLKLTNTHGARSSRQSNAQ